MQQEFRKWLADALTRVAQARGVLVGVSVVLVMAAAAFVFSYLRQAEQARLELIFEGQTRSVPKRPARKIQCLFGDWAIDHKFLCRQRTDRSCQIQCLRRSIFVAVPRHSGVGMDSTCAA